jgi:hypothetical protein
MSESNRATNAELAARRKEIQELIIRGVNSRDIKDQMAAKYNTSRRAIAEDLRVIAKEWESVGEESRVLNRNKALDRLQMLYNMALEKEKIGDSLNILKEIHKLEGLYEEKEKEENKIPDFVKIGVVAPLKKVAGDDSEQDSQH